MEFAGRARDVRRLQPSHRAFSTHLSLNCEEVDYEDADEVEHSKNDISWKAERLDVGVGTR